MRNVCGVSGIFADLTNRRSRNNRQNALLLLFYVAGEMMSFSILAFLYWLSGARRLVFASKAGFSMLNHAKSIVFFVCFRSLA